MGALVEAKQPPKLRPQTRPFLKVGLRLQTNEHHMNIFLLHVQQTRVDFIMIFVVAAKFTMLNMHPSSFCMAISAKMTFCNKPATQLCRAGTMILIQHGINRRKTVLGENQVLGLHFRSSCVDAGGLSMKNPFYRERTIHMLFGNSKSHVSIKNNPEGRRGRNSNNEANCQVKKNPAGRRRRSYQYYTISQYEV